MCWQPFLKRVLCSDTCCTVEGMCAYLLAIPLCLAWLLHFSKVCSWADRRWILCAGVPFETADPNQHMSLVLPAQQLMSPREVEDVPVSWHPPHCIRPC
jgi:hypothetical protein